ncbi:hypothetical protein [Carboxylicivirga sp. N1Y90]|uniref:hypothetical protein n=1 Tax=Carboxylicivirga fragile TaxID=3417571 RepID=UPI003D32CDB3|nr:hypothetical protein [Marinilabiliaceae bacterium N1Y90]
MNKNCKLCWIILGLFFAANVVLLSLWWMSSQKKTDRSRGRGKMEMKRLRQHLESNIGIDSVQFDVFNKLRHVHFEQLNHTKLKIDSIERLLRLETFTDNSDSLKVYGLIDEIAVYQKEVEMQNYIHYRKLRSVCKSEEQRKRLDSNFKNLIDKKHGRHRNRYRSGRSK